MALPDYLRHSAGTQGIWGEAGAAGVTATLSLDALANAKARMGASVDLGASWRQLYYVELVVETGTAPTAGTTVDAYLACSQDGTNWPGGVTGSDASYKDAEENEWVAQLGRPASTLIATNDANAVQRQAPVIWIPKGRYVAPVIHNLLGQAFRDETAATDNDSRLILTPVNSLIQDAE